MRAPLRRVALAALLATVIALSARAACAADSPCSPDVTAWVARAALDTQLSLYAASCWEHGARIEIGGVAPLAIEVSDGPGEAFRKVGLFRVAPILEIDDFSRVDVARRDAFERVVGWMEGHEGEVRFGGAPPSPSPSRAPWLLLAAVALAFACRFGGVTTGRDRVAALALFGGALALRGLLGAWGPLHVNGKGPLWIAAAASNGAEVSFYGPGYAEIFGPIARAARSPDVALFAENGVVSALMAPLAFALGRALGLSVARAAFAAALLALDPVAVRGSTTEGYFAVIAALALGASFAAASATNAWARGETARGVGWALVSALACAQAVRVHPAAWVPAALAPLVALSASGRSSRRVAVTSAVYAIVATTVLAADGRVLVAVLAHLDAGELHAPSFHAARLVWLLPLVALAVWTKPKNPWLLVPAVASVAALLVTRDTYLQSAMWQASFDRLYVAVPVVVAVAVASDALGARARMVAATVSCGAVAAFAPLAFGARTTEQLEYRWLRGELAAVPRECRILHVERVDKRELYLPIYGAPGKGPCAYYIHSSLCASREGAPVCDATERRFVFGAADRATFPAVPSSRELPYDGAEVAVWIARVDAVEP